MTREGTVHLDQSIHPPFYPIPEATQVCRLQVYPYPPKRWAT